MNLNKVVIAGRIGQDLTVKSLQGGTDVLSFSVASNRNWTDKQSGEKKEQTEWHNVVFFGKRANVIAQYFRKGKEIYIEGRLQTRMWEKDGRKNYRTEIVGDKFEFVGYDKDGAGGAPATNEPANATPPSTTAVNPTKDVIEIDTTKDIKPGDLPF